MIKFYCLIALTSWVTISFPVNDVVNFQISLRFLIKPFSCMTKKGTY